MERLGRDLRSLSKAISSVGPIASWRNDVCGEAGASVAQRVGFVSSIQSSVPMRGAMELVQGTSFTSANSGAK